MFVGDSRLHRGTFKECFLHERWELLLRRGTFKEPGVGFREMNGKSKARLMDNQGNEQTKKNKTKMHK